MSFPKNIEESDFCVETDSCPSIACEKTTYQKTKVNVPVVVKPFGVAGDIKIKCCGIPVVSSRSSCGTKDICEYVITQEICIEIPIKFGAFTKVNDTYVDCGSICTKNERECL